MECWFLNFQHNLKLWKFRNKSLQCFKNLCKLNIFNTGKINTEQGITWLAALIAASKLFIAVIISYKLEWSRYQYIMKEKHNIIMSFLASCPVWVSNYLNHHFLRCHRKYYEKNFLLLLGITSLPIFRLLRQVIIEI